MLAHWGWGWGWGAGRCCGGEGAVVGGGGKGCVSHYILDLLIICPNVKMSNTMTMQEVRKKRT